MDKKTKKTINVRELINQYQQNCDRITEIADVCEKEQRERNEAENTEFETLMRENQLLQMKMQAATAEHLREIQTPRKTQLRLSVKTPHPVSVPKSCFCVI